MPGLSYSKGPDAPISELTLSEALARTASRFPDRTALVSRHQNIRLTWRDFDAQVTRVARGLAGLGLKPQDRVGVWAVHCVEWLLVQYACARAGYVLVNVNPSYRAHELGFVLRKSQMKALFLWERDERNNYDEILKTAGPALDHIIYFGTASWESMLANGSELPSTPVRNTDPTNIQYTSGTTGSPKGVLLTHRNLVNNALYTGHWLHATETDVMVVPFPLYHCAGSICCALNCVTTGAAIILPSGHFDALATLQAIQGERATMIGGVPTMYVAQLQHPEFQKFDLSSLRVGFIGGAPCPVELLKRMSSEMHCRDVCVIYGQTEASPIITMHGDGDTFEQRTSTIGRAFSNTEVRIVNPETNQPLPIGQTGELCTRGYHVMSGYDQEPEATSRAIDPEGWLHTGDLAIMRDDGHFHIVGRSKDMIIRGGENIYPAELENFLATHPSIAEAHVVGLPDLKLGEVVAAWVRLKPGAETSAAEIRQFCQGSIAHYKVPQQIRIVDSFPMTVTGKVQKFRIRELETEMSGRTDQALKTA